MNFANDPPARLAIVGTGLLGCSVGLAARRRWPDIEVIGVARRAATRREALDGGGVTAATEDVGEAVADADLIVLCTPVDSIAQFAQEAASRCRDGARITDVGSTKAEILRKIAADDDVARRFVGSHPLAGGEKSGPGSASGDLFDDRMVVVTPSAHNAEADVAWIEAFWRELGAETCRMTPEDHDAAVAVTSHLPHLVAALLARRVDAAVEPLVGQGWLDTTRIAAGDAAMWRQIVAHNRAAVLRELSAFLAAGQELAEALEHSDFDRIERLLEEAAARRMAIAAPSPQASV